MNSSSSITAALTAAPSSISSTVAERIQKIISAAENPDAEFISMADVDDMKSVGIDNAIPVLLGAFSIPPAGFCNALKEVAQHQEDNEVLSALLKAAQSRKDFSALLNYSSRITASPLQEAIEFGNPIAVRLLLDAGVDPCLPNAAEDDQTSLYAAISFLEIQYEDKEEEEMDIFAVEEDEEEKEWEEEMMNNRFTALEVLLVKGGINQVFVDHWAYSSTLPLLISFLQDWNKNKLLKDQRPIENIINYLYKNLSSDKRTSLECWEDIKDLWLTLHPEEKPIPADAKSCVLEERQAAGGLGKLGTFGEAPVVGGRRDRASEPPPEDQKPPKKARPPMGRREPVT